MKSPRRLQELITLILSCVVLASICSTFSCSGKKLGPDDARRLIAKELQIPENDVEVNETSEIGGAFVAETKIRFTVVLQKNANGEWKLIRVRRSDNNWLSPEAFRQSLPPAFSEALARALLNEVNSN